MDRPDFRLLRQVSRANIERDVRYLSTAWPNRHTLGPHHVPCATWIARRLRSLGFFPKLHTYRRAEKDLHNVIAPVPTRTAVAPRRVVIACAHFDSRQENIDDPSAPAPGADDNATGVAVLLEVARILGQTPPQGAATLRLCFFSGEEQGLWGSTAYADDLREMQEVALAFNLDQIGYPPPDRALFVDQDQGGKPENNAASTRLVARLRTLAQTVVGVPTRVDPAYGSDYMPFEARGIPIVGLYEAGAHYPHYHKASDTADQVDFAYVHDFARLTLAGLLDLAHNP